MPKVLASSKALIYHNGKYLIVKESLHRGENVWDLPGGKIEYGENPEETVMREVKAIVRIERLDPILHALHEMPDLPGVTVSEIRGVGRRTDVPAGEAAYGENPMVKLELVVLDAQLEAWCAYDHRAVEDTKIVGHRWSAPLAAPLPNMSFH